jgi:hypothetical protein
MSLAITVLDEYRLRMASSNLDKPEDRLANYGAFQTFLADTAITLPGYQTLIDERKSADRTVSVVVGEAFNPVVTDTRTCTPSADEMTSAYVTPYWDTVETSFFMNAAQNEDNYVSYADQFARQMTGVARVFLNTNDAACVAHLAANLSGVNNAEDNPYAVVADYMQVAAAENFNFFNEYGSIAMANTLPPLGHNVIGSPRLMSIVRGYQNQGGGNALNTAFQFAGYNFSYTNNIATASGDMAVLYTAPVGSLAFLTWIDPDCRIGSKIGDERIWTTMFIPQLGHEVGVYYTAACEDRSNVKTGFERTKVDVWEFSYDYTILSSYNSAPLTVPGVIYGAQFLNV